MHSRATVTIDLAMITENTRCIVDALGGREVIGVTKVTCASPEVARAMLAGGASGLADSRLENIAHLREAGITAPIWLLRSPTPALADETVRYADVSLESELVTVRALDAAAREAGTRHGIIAMVDLGDLREGVMPEELPRFLKGVMALENIDIIGIGTSLTCYGAIVPTADNLGMLAALASVSEKEVGHPLVVSGGMSSSLDALVAGDLPPAVTNLRIGESILLGVSTVTREPILGLHTDAITLSAPIIECLRKPSKPRGISAQDAFGGRPSFQDRGVRRRAICAIGRQDAPPEGLIAVDPRAQVLGASSDHLIVDVEDLPTVPKVGDTLKFVPNYSAMLRLFTSPYVDKVFMTPMR
ncbi:MAG: alanine/ornithine racemase family PLP-dependent enzyme [Actinomycetota bacterium]|nr:alanine/ornithine racemase family PLP-dependent enzyme [Actinomycetota bacterium]MDP3630187.1 alanine/ornithine racemase family PLP-dependent enzyme [Actinomycetota bacterium]